MPAPFEADSLLLVAWILLMNVPEPKGKAIMTTITATADSARKPIYQSLFVQVLAALLLGIVLGMAVPDFAVGLKIFSDAFLKLISMIVGADRVLRGGARHCRRRRPQKGRTGRRQGADLFRGDDHGRAGRRPGARLCVRPGHGMNIDPSTLDAKAINTYADNAHKLQGGGIGELPAQHHPDHLVRRAVAQRRAAGAVLRDPVRHRPGAGRRRKGRENRLHSSTRFRPCCSGSWA